MASYIPLPAYQIPRNALLDLSPINDAIDTGIKVKQQGIENQYRERDFGMRERQLKSAEADRAADRAFRAQQFKFQQDRALVDDRYRDRSYGLQERQLAEAAAQRGIDNQYRDRRFDLDQTRAATDERFRGDALKIQQEEAEDRRNKTFLSAAGGVAQLIAEDQDTARAQAQWQRLMQSDPRWQQWAKTRGIDPNDHVNGARQMIAEVRGYVPQDKGQKFVTIPENSTPGFVDPQTKTFVPATGFENRPPKLSDSDKTRIYDITQSSQSAQTAIQTLEEAAKLNETARAGALAKPIASVVSGASPLPTPASDDALKLDAKLKEIALQQLKSTFGGNPTEGEREILLQLTGSVNNNRAVRGALIQAAREAAINRQRYQSRIAEDVRTGRIYQPGYQPPQIQDAPVVQQWLRSGGVTNPVIPRDGAQRAMPTSPSGLPQGWKVEVE